MHRESVIDLLNKNKTHYIFLSLLSCFSLFSQSKLELIHADKQHIIQQKVVQNIGRVNFRNDTVDIKSDFAVWYKTESKIILTGRVNIKTPKSLIQSDRAVYYSSLDLAKFYNNVHITSTESDIKCDSLHHLYKKDISYLFGNVQIQNKIENTTTMGDYIISRQNQVFDIYGSAYYNRPSDSLTIQSDKLHYNKQLAFSEANDNVVITRANITSYGQRSKFFEADSILRLYGEPYVVFSSSKVSGDSIISYFSDDGIRQMDVMGNAVSTQVIDSITQRINKVVGRQIIMTFEQGDLIEMQSIRNAISIYYLKDEGKDNGTNSVSSDSLFIFFADNKPKNIIAKGGVEGTFYPPDYKGIIKNDY